MSEAKQASGGRPQLPDIDVHERATFRGREQSMDRRLFMQLQVFRSPIGADAAKPAKALHGALAGEGIGAVVYADANDPRGIGLLTWSEDPAHFVDAVRPLFARHELSQLELRPELTMMGRTYATGFEPDLEYWLLKRPAENATQEGWPWAVWYPLRRSGAFAQLSDEEQRSILMEHALIGRAYGAKELAHDVRLACHGLDQADNEFVIGLIGKDLHPLSHVVQRMRSTQQTSKYIVQMGPFFVGKTLHVSRPTEAPADGG
ncbi:MAG: chlorite dismutase family protein [Deltaproteobacteria bacterium]|nr:chlorite dismutase family protein [Deltaproteobacteria bacterium]